ncbi:GTP cyclohydrolase II [Thalassotalea fusca]
MNKDVLFYEPNDKYGYLSNFAPYPISFENSHWLTTEHCYQASKYKDPKIIEEIRNAASPELAFAISRKYAAQERPDWKDIRYDRMFEIVKAKFEQHKTLAYYLVSTKDCVIKEHSHKDSYWGDGGDGNGQNMLGKILMTIRESLLQTVPFTDLQYVESTKLPTQYGEFVMHGFIEPQSGQEHVALTLGKWERNEPVLLRLHSECLTGDAFGSLRCDCGPQLSQALENIANNGSGVLFYLRQEGRGIGLLNKIKAYHLQDCGADTVEANTMLGFAPDQRRYSFCRGIFEFLNISRVELMTNNPAKISAVQDLGIEVVNRIQIELGQNEHNHAYLATKQKKMGHMFR